MYWLVVSTLLKQNSQLGWLFPMHGDIQHIPNHQSVYIHMYIYILYSYICKYLHKNMYIYIYINIYTTLDYHCTWMCLQANYIMIHLKTCDTSLTCSKLMFQRL